MLQTVLAEKGVPMSAHYDLQPRHDGGTIATRTQPERIMVSGSPSTTDTGRRTEQQPHPAADLDDGIYL